MTKTILKNYLINIFCGKSRILLNEDVVQLILDFLGYNSSRFGVYKHVYGNSRTNLIVSKIVLKKYLDNIFCGKPNKTYESRVLLNVDIVKFILVDFLGYNIYSSYRFIKNFYLPSKKDLEPIYSFTNCVQSRYPKYIFKCNEKKIINTMCFQDLTTLWIHQHDAGKMFEYLFSSLVACYIGLELPELFVRVPVTDEDDETDRPDYLKLKLDLS